MNETVARIVELLFQDVEMNDEVKAIHDEVMNNCQERFGDLLDRGFEEDEAIAAVVESLKGMEEMLAGYPRKAVEPEADSFEKTSRPQQAVLVGRGRAGFSAHGLRRVSVAMKSEDVIVELSPDEETHVICDIGENEKHLVTVVAEMVDGELRVTRGKSEDGSEWTKKHVNAGGADIHFNFKDLKFESIGDLLNKVMGNIQLNFGDGETVRVQVPAFAHLERVEVQTGSGDVGVNDVTTDALEVSSRSGDLTVELPGDRMLKHIELRTTSGDAEVRLSAKEAQLHSMSGDLRFAGAARTLDISSTSGDVTVKLEADTCEKCSVRSVSGDVECTGAARVMSAGSTSGDIELNTTSEEVSFSSVSGDVNVKSRNDRLRSVEGHTVSGDVTIRLPESVRGADVSFSTTSGDVRQKVPYVEGAPLRIRLQTVSGLIDVE